ncbi:hypothetical protein GMORB2_6415 [Geosmithia morbida]|uniref:Uncharacterized protein n=1 Tax=Geosmithia morbida TaxID=1094350 RepID=A0A9P4YXQ1_9HYPO|nr:uncharacterized protein GMORB2_6415 [Geosmithia morbida]KAF4123714.1 hypothetical protein GMORB2_6415 [Geosmithia morbida]
MFTITLATDAKAYSYTRRIRSRAEEVKSDRWSGFRCSRRTTSPLLLSID